jgi:integrase
MALLLCRLERREGDKVLGATRLLFPSHDQHGKPRATPWGKDAVTKRFGRWVKLAGLPKSLTVHSLRHTFASHLVKRRVSLELVGELLGHSSVVVTKIYAHLQPSELDWVVDLLDFDQSSIMDRIRRGKEERAEVFGRRELSKVADEQAEEIKALRSEIYRLKRKK